jgi:hypothetical protein
LDISGHLAMTTISFAPFYFGDLEVSATFSAIGILFPFLFIYIFVIALADLGPFCMEGF